MRVGGAAAPVAGCCLWPCGPPWLWQAAGCGWGRLRGVPHLKLLVSIAAALAVAKTCSVLRLRRAHLQRSAGRPSVAAPASSCAGSMTAAIRSPPLAPPYAAELAELTEYWTELRGAIQRSPPTAARHDTVILCGPFSGTPPGQAHGTAVVGMVVDEAVQAVCTCDVSFHVNGRELRQTLARAATALDGSHRSRRTTWLPWRRRGSDDTYDDGVRSAVLGSGAVELAVLWMLEHVRAVYDAIAVHGDANGGEDELDEILVWSSRFYAAFVAATPAGSQARQVWALLAQQVGRLRWRRRQLVVGSVRSLVRYLRRTLRGRVSAVVVTVALTVMSTRVSFAGLRLRQGIEDELRALSQASATAGPSWEGRDGGRGGLRQQVAAVGVLCAAELLRLAVSAALVRATNDYIALSTARSRDAVKAELYHALVRTDTVFFDAHAADDLEPLVLYVNDLEGVEVNLQRFATNALRTFGSAYSTMVVLDVWERLVVLTAVWLTVGARALASVYAAYCVAPHREVDAEEHENLVSATADDGVMLRGLEIVCQVPGLRPYGADVELMEWWTRHARDQQQRHGGYGAGGESPGGRAALQTVLRLAGHRSLHLSPTAGQSLVALVEWLVPVMAVSLSLTRCERRRTTLLEAVHAVEGAVAVVLDVKRVVDVVVVNAYKAAVLERLLDPARWETAAAAAAAAVEVATAVAPPRPEASGGGVALDWLRVVDLQFQYPSAPTVNVFATPLSFHVRLRDGGGRGRLVCLTGPSGAGKSTLLKLLLGMYRPAPPSTIELGLVVPEAGAGGAAGEAVATALGAIDPPFLRRKLFAFVPQTPLLFDGATIAHNVSLANHVSVTSRQTLERVRQCAGESQCLAFIDQLPNGVLTTLSDVSGFGCHGGVRLSVGQAQRLMVARALYRGGAVLLMDEPTASLDAATRSAVLRVCRHLLDSGRIAGILCVTHDEVVLGAADEVVHVG